MDSTNQILDIRMSSAEQGVFSTWSTKHCKLCFCPKRPSYNLLVQWPIPCSTISCVKVTYTIYSALPSSSKNGLSSWKQAYLLRDSNSFIMYLTGPRKLTHSSSYDIRYRQSLCSGVVSQTWLQAPDKSAVKVVAAGQQGSNWKWMGKLCIFAAVLGLVWTQPVAGSRYKIIWPIICQIPPPNQCQQTLDYLMGLKIILPGFPAVWGVSGSDFTLPYLLGRLIITLHKLFYLWPPPQYHKQSVILCETLLLCGEHQGKLSTHSVNCHVERNDSQSDSKLTEDRSRQFSVRSLITTSIPSSCPTSAHLFTQKRLILWDFEFQSLVVDGWNLLVGGVFFGGHLVAHHTLKLKSLMLFCCAQSGSGSRDLLRSGESNVFFGP